MTLRASATEHGPLSQNYMLHVYIHVICNAAVNVCVLCTFPGNTYIEIYLLFYSSLY